MAAYQTVYTQTHTYTLVTYSYTTQTYSTVVVNFDDVAGFHNQSPPLFSDKIVRTYLRPFMLADVKWLKY